jgi:hypothetical protein
MDGLRYYVGSLLLIATATYAAEKEELSPKLQMLVVLPTGSNLNMSSRTFYLPLSKDVATIAAIRKLFTQEVEKLAKQKPDCDCGGPCADIRAAKVLVNHKGMPLQITYLGTKTNDDTTLDQLHDAGFKLGSSALYAKF